MAGAPVRQGSGSTGPAEVFRPRGWLRYSVLAAIVFWLAMLVCLIVLRAPTDRAFVGVAFFITLFSILSIFYNNTAIEVTTDGVIVRGMASFRLVPYSDIMKIDVRPGVLQTTYAVRARQGFVFFTSLFAGHQRLLQLIVERAQLARS